MKDLTKCVLITATLFVLYSCMDKNGLNGAPEPTPEPEKPSVEDYFDFNTMQTIKVNIDYGFNDYLVLFELFDENPTEEPEDGSIIKKENIKGLFKASTDKSGRFSGNVTIPARTEKIWLYSDYLGTVSPIELTIKDKSISFNQNDYIASHRDRTRAVTPVNEFKYPDEYKILGDWSESGKPTYLLPKANTPDYILYNIKETYSTVKNKYISIVHPEFLENNFSSDIILSKATKIKLVFVNSGAGYKNVVGYYTYPKNETPEENKITKIIAFPNITRTDQASIFSRDQVELKYWDGTQFQDEFPAGVAIGFFLQPNGFSNNNGTIENPVKGNAWNATKYSSPNLNYQGEKRTIALLDAISTQMVTIGFEDGKDNNFSDATFYLDIAQKDAVEKNTIPDLPDENAPTPDDNVQTTFGTLTYEDKWPEEGDYDMNDMIVEYKRDIHKSILTNKVEKIIDTFIPKHDGANWQNGFGYQLTGISNSDIKKITIESGGIVSQFMEGKDREPGQDYPTIILFDNQKTAINKTFTVTIDVTQEKFTETAFIPFFNNDYWEKTYSKFNMNPFIIISSGTGRDKEAHIVKFPPTSKMNFSYFGTGSDVSKPDEGLYYVNSENMPTGLQISGVRVGTKRSADFLVPIEKTSILEAYPKFGAWASSFGASNGYWWKDPDNSKVITQ